MAHKLKRTPYPRIFGHVLHGLAKYRVRVWDRALRNVRKTQLDQLMDIVGHCADTEFGRRHDFAKIKTARDWAAAVPVGDYDSFSPAIDRMRQGERNILVPEFVEYFGNSSGSSQGGQQKFLPITERQIKHQQDAGSDSLFRYVAWKGMKNFPQGFVLGLFPPINMRQEGPVKITCNPALMMDRMHPVMNPLYIPDRQTMKLEDYDQKLEIIAERYIDHDVHMITGTTCWFSILFDKLLAAAKRRGRNVSTVRELWPNLTILTGGGVAAGPYMAVLRERMGRDDFVLIDTYNATEGGIYATTDHDAGPGLLMLPHRGVYFEFVPVEDIESGTDNPRRVPLWEVEPGRLYGIVVTSTSGLFAYKLGDIVRFASTDPLRIEFAGRLQGCLSTTQELTTHIEIQRAFDEALEVEPATAIDYAAGADVGIDGTAKSRYVLFAEFTADKAPSDEARFIDAFDDALCKQNRVYKEHRHDDLGILSPELVVMPAGTVDRYMKDVGNSNVQAKFPRILDDNRKEALRTLTRKSAGG